MSLPVPRSLQNLVNEEQREKAGIPKGALSVQSVEFTELKLGRIELEFTFRPTHFVLHAFCPSGPFPLNFGQKLQRVVYGGWPGAKEVKVEWIEELRSYCVRVFQKGRPQDWGEEQVLTLLREGLA
jgi:hypothetical protein